jgi:streptomycin 6-kinase
VIAAPELIEDLARRWMLTVGDPFAHPTLSYVAPATRADGTRCVLKLGRDVAEVRHAAAALRAWDGRGAARLLEAEPEVRALLIERLEPGSMLVEVANTDDEAATRVAADLWRQLWQPLPDEHGLRSLDSWCAAYERNRDALEGGARGFPAEVFRRADALRRDLLASTEAPVVLHGDLHHFNILRAQRADWLAIDPKGLAGDRCFDVCQLLRNPREVPPSVNRRRLDILCAELGLDHERTRAWCYVHAVLDACWQFEEGQPWQRTLAYAEETRAF